jgi:hypothetical protein
MRETIVQFLKIPFVGVITRQLRWHIIALLFFYRMDRASKSDLRVWNRPI